MCNLSEGLIEQGIENEQRRIIAICLKKGESPDDIHAEYGYPLEIIKSVQDELLQTV